MGGGTALGEKLLRPTCPLGECYALQKAMRYLEQKNRLGLPDDPELEESLLQTAVDDVMLVGMDSQLEES